MYKKKELFIFLGLLSFIIIFILIKSFDEEKEDNDYIINMPDNIVIKIDGEIVRPIKLEYNKPISYGVLFIKIKNNLNEYSDLSSFDHNEIISESINISIPSNDNYSQYSTKDKININTATASELVKLPQIGEKRAQKIINYIDNNGKIKSWNIFFDIVGVPENVKETIKNQAIL